MELDPGTTAVIVVDMQTGFCKENGSLYSERCEQVIPHVKTFVEDARDAGCTIVYTRDTHEPDGFNTNSYDEYERWGRHCVRGTEDTNIVDELQPREDEVVVQKGTYSGFHSTFMDQYLTTKGINTVVVVGVLTNVCVLHTASGAALRDYKPVVVEDCTEALSEEDKEYALHHVDWLFGEVTERSNIAFTETPADA